MVNVPCPIWGTDGELIKTRHPGLRFYSPRAGGYFAISYEANSRLKGYLTSHNFKQKFSLYVYNFQKKFISFNFDSVLMNNFITIDTLKLIYKSLALNFSEKKENFFRFCMSRDKDLGANFLQYNPEEKQSLLASSELKEEELQQFLLMLETSQLIKTHNDAQHFSIDFKGYEYIDMLQKGGVDSNNAFVAMWFNEQTNDLYNTVFEPVLDECGYKKPYRVDQKNHANKIDDEIIAMIRASRLVLVDFTCDIIKNKSSANRQFIHRGGVYYEAGFAQGLNRPVIWTCRSDCINGLHFDIRHYVMLQWYEDAGQIYLKNDLQGDDRILLRNALKNRISALNLNLNTLSR